MQVHAMSMLVVGGLLSAVGVTVANQPVRIIDGDSIGLAGYHIVRIVGLDTPEIGGKAKCPRERALADRVQARMSELLAHGDVTIDWSQKQNDPYCRPLARVLVDGRDVADILVAEGLARYYDGKGPRKSWCPKKTG